MGAHSRPGDEQAVPTTQATYDSRGDVNAAVRVVVTKPIRNYPAFFALAGALVSLVIFSWIFIVLVIGAAGFGYAISKTAVREGKYCALVGGGLAVLLALLHLAGA